MKLRFLVFLWSLNLRAPALKGEPLSYTLHGIRCAVFVQTSGFADPQFPLPLSCSRLGILFGVGKWRLKGEEALDSLFSCWEETHPHIFRLCFRRRKSAVHRSPLVLIRVLYSKGAILTNWRASDYTVFKVCIHASSHTHTHTLHLKWFYLN